VPLVIADWQNKFYEVKNMENMQSKEFKEKETAREAYLRNFERRTAPVDKFFPESKEFGTKIVEMMKKEDLTYDQAFLSLQYAYDLLNYRSNFLNVQ